MLHDTSGDPLISLRPPPQPNGAAETPSCLFGGQQNKVGGAILAPRGCVLKSKIPEGSFYWDLPNSKANTVDFLFTYLLFSRFINSVNGL